MECREELRWWWGKGSSRRWWRRINNAVVGGEYRLWKVVMRMMGV